MLRGRFIASRAICSLRYRGHGQREILIPLHNMLGNRRCSSRSSPDNQTAGTSIPEPLTDIITSSAPVFDYYSPSQIIMSIIDYGHTFFGVPYWESIIGITVVMRCLLVPLGISTAINTARMGAMRPELEKLQNAMKSDPRADDMAVKTRYQQEMKAVFLKHKAKPLQAVALPLVQLPLFMSFFFALKEMGIYVPDVVSGGAYWFENLSVADPTMILPLVNAFTFWVMVEIGADGMKTENHETFKWVMRFLAVGITPLTMDLPAGLFVYWVTNNVFSIAQAGVLKSPSVKDYFGIPKPPTNAPAVKVRNPFSGIFEAIKKERAQTDTARAEIVDGSRPPPPPSGGSHAQAPVTFASPPNKKKNKK